MITNNNQTPDAKLIAEFIAGNNEAIGKLFEKYQAKIYNYILMLVKERYIADDLYQEVFIKISSFIKDGRYVDDGRFINWVLRIAHNKVIDHFRNIKSQKEVSTDDEDKPIQLNDNVLGGNIEDKMIKSQLEKDVRKLVDNLPVEQREVVILRHYFDMSFKDIADQTGVSINTALGRMRYALINLRKMIEDNHISLDYAAFA